MTNTKWNAVFHASLAVPCDRLLIWVVVNYCALQQSRLTAYLVTRRRQKAGRARYVRSPKTNG